MTVCPVLIIIAETHDKYFWDHVLKPQIIRRRQERQSFYLNICFNEVKQFALLSKEESYRLSPRRGDLCLRWNMRDSSVSRNRQLSLDLPKKKGGPYLQINPLLCNSDMFFESFFVSPFSSRKIRKFSISSCSIKFYLIIFFTFLPLSFFFFIIFFTTSVDLHDI